MPPPDRIVSSYDASAAWSSDAPTSELSREEDRAILNLRGGKRHEVTLAGEFSPGSFNLMRVELRCRRDMTLRVGVGSEGAGVGSPDFRHAYAGERYRFEFDLRAAEKAPSPFDSLVLIANPSGKEQEELDWSLLSVSLLERAPEHWLPLPGEPPRLIDLEGEARRGVGLAANAPITLSVDGGRRGGELCFALGPPPRMEGGGRVRVVVGGEERLTAALPAGGSPPWHGYRLPLPGGPCKVRFTLEGAPLASLEQPLFLPAGRAAPTVLLISSDTHRADALGGGLTPRLDALAARGVLFENCFSSSNNTLPSHDALMTGLDPAQTGVIDNQMRLSEEAYTLADRFAEAGYRTFAATSAKHMNDPWSGLGQGFDRFAYPDESREQPSTATLAMVERWLGDAQGDPLLLWVHLFDAHRPYDPPPEAARAEYGSGDPRDPALPEPPWPTPGPLEGIRDAAWVRALYRAQVGLLDQRLARLLDRPRIRAGWIAFTADHGESLGEQGIFWNHLGVYPAVLHVPLILAGPGVPEGRRIQAPVRQLDLAHTLAGLAGLAEPGGAELAGTDLARFWNRPDPRDVPRFALGSDGHAVSVTFGRWMLVVNLAVPKELGYTRDLPHEEPLALFDLEHDPLATHDLAAGEPERVARLGRALLEWLENARASFRDEHAEGGEGAATLAALGYASGERTGHEGVDMDLLRARLAPYLGE